MKLSTSALIFITGISSSTAFAPASQAFIRSGSSTVIYAMEGMDLSGNAWKPDTEKMGSTDTGDFFPEGYENDIGK
jgi:hypothetical protein